MTDQAPAVEADTPEIPGKPTSASRTTLSHIMTHNDTNLLGTVHGGVIMSLLDVALCTAARTLHPDSVGVVTIDMSTSFIGGGSGARLLADARVMKDARTMSFVEAEAKNEDGSIVAKAIATVRVRMKEKT